ncbi:putative cytosine deaminase [Klebsiella pneumoniae]|uniref:Putative cytosine deaminase n=1 Tax=Klebsiella pneumoniae TaxID=573 RepID=A0A377V6T3_KLEPN|nr:putative cytosine deaminase [Klebsiella pneumoniae]
MLSCEQGMCGSCITGVLDGIPEHRDSVLTAEEKADNDQITLWLFAGKIPASGFGSVRRLTMTFPLLLRAARRDQPRPTPGLGAARRLADAGQR